jgi:hydroxypyruvate isomerase
VPAAAVASGAAGQAQIAGSMAGLIDGGWIEYAGGFGQSYTPSEEPLMSQMRDVSSLRSSRRTLLKGAVGSLAMAAVPGAALAAAKRQQQPMTVDLAKIEKVIVNGRINQGICGVGLRLDMEQKCALCQKLGARSIDFTGPADWPTLKKYNLVASLCRGAASIPVGWNRKENHEKLIEDMKKNIDAVSEAGWGTVITFSGNRHKSKDDKEGVSDEEGIKVCAEGLKQVAKYAEDKKVTIVMELLNSKRNHKDYQCDHTAWGVEMCKAVGSERVKLLYDIYHMQIMEGDMIATIKEFNPYIGHYHTAGVPGRHELDENQEIYYPAVMRAIVDTGYKGYVSHEYGPAGDPIKALVQALKVCDV